MPRYLAIFLLLLGACTPSETPDNAAVDTLLVPAGEQAAGPRLSVGSGGPLVLSWMEPDAAGTTLWYSTLAGTAWEPPRPVVRGKDMFVNWADLPSVTALGDGHWVAHWLEMAGSERYAYHVVMTQSFDGGQTWSGPVKPHSDGTPTEHGFVSVYPQDGMVAAIWLDGRKAGGGHAADHGSNPGETGMTLRSAVIDADNGIHDDQEIDDLVCDCCQTDVAMTAQGPVVVYRDRAAGETRDIYVARHLDGRWQTGVPLHEDNWQIAGCPVNGPAIGARGDTVAAAWFSAPEQTPAVRLRFSQDSAVSFGPVFTLATDGALGHVDVVVLGDGSAVVSWLQADPDGLGTLVMRRVTSEGEMGAVVSVASGAPARSVPQMAVAGDNLVLVWTEAQAETKRVASARIPLDSIAVD